MKTIVLGYSDERGLSKSVVVADANVSQADQIKLVADAKNTGVLPKGLARLEFCTIEAHTVALPWGEQPETKTKNVPNK